MSLFRDRQRFAIAAWVAFEPDFGPHATARLVTVVIEEDTPVRIEDHSEALPRHVVPNIDPVSVRPHAVTNAAWFG